MVRYSMPKLLQVKWRLAYLCFLSRSVKLYQQLKRPQKGHFLLNLSHAVFQERGREGAGRINTKWAPTYYYCTLEANAEQKFRDNVTNRNYEWQYIRTGIKTCEQFFHTNSLGGKTIYISPLYSSWYTQRKKKSHEKNFISHIRSSRFFPVFF